MTDRAVPNLPSREFEATIEFYGRFGFVQHFRDDSWLIPRRGAVQLEFFPLPELDPRTSSFMCSIRVADLDERTAVGVRARTVHAHPLGRAQTHQTGAGAVSGGECDGRCRYWVDSPFLSRAIWVEECVCGWLLAVIGEGRVDDDVVEVGARSAVEYAAAGDQA